MVFILWLQIRKIQDKLQKTSTNSHNCYLNFSDLSGNVLAIAQSETQRNNK